MNEVLLNTLIRSIDMEPGQSAMYYIQETKLPKTTVYRYLTHLKRKGIIDNENRPVGRAKTGRHFIIPDALKMGVLHTEKPSAHLATMLAALKSDEYPPGITLTKGEILQKVKKDFLADASRAVALVSELQNLLATYALITGDLNAWEHMSTKPRMVLTKELDEL